MKKPKFLPCPFCGSSKLDDQHENCVECTNCDAQVLDIYYTRKQALKAWNRRTQSKDEK